jgi:hypothetical protein
MDVFMRELLMDRNDVVIVSDSAKIPCYASERGMVLVRRASSSSFDKLTSLKADSRWKCRSDASIGDGEKGQDSALPKPSEIGRLRRKSVSRKKNKGLSRTVAHDSSIGENALQDKHKAQSIIKLVQSLSLRAVITVRGPKENGAAKSA